MELSVIYSRALAGIDAPPVRVETHLSNGLPAFHIVGLPETAVREAKDRVRSALINSHFEFPDRRITVNLAPADLPKGGGRFDLPIALGILAASHQVPRDQLARHEFVGELALDGSLRPVPGVVAAGLASRAEKRTLVVADDSAPRAAIVPGARIIGAPDLLTLCAHLNGAVPLQPAMATAWSKPTAYPDLADVVGQAPARRALEIAAAGGHHLLLHGPPGTGKSLLASRLPGILPQAESEEVLTNLVLQDAQGLGEKVSVSPQRPLRTPHHSASAAALAGGGARPRPGEISLAHGGVLFLDELPEFNRQCLEVLREPLETGAITLSRANQKVTYPARFQLVAAMNPCPCGYLGDDSRPCRCHPDQIKRYRGRISGPLLDRIDLHVSVGRLPPETLLAPCANEEPSAEVRARVERARERQQQRQGCVNNDLDSGRLLEVCALEREAKALLTNAGDTLKLSGRGIHRTLRVARTIADMNESAVVAAAHIGEALAFRSESNA